MLTRFDGEFSVAHLEMGVSYNFKDSVVLLLYPESTDFCRVVGCWRRIGFELQRCF